MGREPVVRAGVLEVEAAGQRSDPGAVYAADQSLPADRQGDGATGSPPPVLAELINQVVAALLKKLLIEQTKSRARHSGDNGLVDTQNAAIVRKHMGFGYIDPAQAVRVNQFYTAFLMLQRYRPICKFQMQLLFAGGQGVYAPTAATGKLREYASNPERSERVETLWRNAFI